MHDPTVQHPSCFVSRQHDSLYSSTTPCFNGNVSRQYNTASSCVRPRSSPRFTGSCSLITPFTRTHFRLAFNLLAFPCSDEPRIQCLEILYGPLTVFSKVPDQRLRTLIGPLYRVVKFWVRTRTCCEAILYRRDGRDDKSRRQH